LLLRFPDALDDVFLEVEGLFEVEPGDCREIDVGEPSFLVQIGAEIPEI
jgi:hypothetical protein